MARQLHSYKCINLIGHLSFIPSDQYNYFEFAYKAPFDLEGTTVPVLDSRFYCLVTTVPENMFAGKDYSATWETVLSMQSFSPVNHNVWFWPKCSIWPTQVFASRGYMVKQILGFPEDHFWGGGPPSKMVTPSFKSPPPQTGRNAWIPDAFVRAFQG